MVTHDINDIRYRKKIFSDELNNRDMCIRFRAAALEYLGEEPDPNDPVGYVSSPKKSFLATSVTILRGEGTTEARDYANSMTKSKLWDEFDTAYQEIGFEDENSNPRAYVINQRNGKVGPIIPWILAVLSSSHGLDIEDALRKHGDAIDAANREDSNEYLWEYRDSYRPWCE